MIMGPIAATESVLLGYFKFSGRAARSEYWWWGLVQFLFLTTCIVIDSMLITDLDASPRALLSSSLTVAFVALTIIPNFSVTVRRLHDTNKSGFWYLINFLPFGSLIFLVFMVMPSTPDDNIYGPEPKRDTTRGRGTSNDDAYNPYEALNKPSADEIAARQVTRKSEIEEYYKTRVLKKEQAEVDVYTPPLTT